MILFEFGCHGHGNENYEDDTEFLFPKMALAISFNITPGIVTIIELSEHRVALGNEQLNDEHRETSNKLIDIIVQVFRRAGV